MKFVTRFILAFLIFSLNFDREGHAALNSGDVATPLYVQNFDVSDQATRPRGITFNNDGSKMYIVGQDSDKVHEYNLSINFNVSTASFVHSFSVSSQENVPSSVKFNNDGTKMFIVGTQRSRVHEYILSTAFNISTASHESFVSVKSEEDCAWALDFNNDGTKMFITGCTGAGANNEDINEYSLNVGFDLSAGVNFVQLKKLADIGLRDPEDEPYGIEFNPDGTTMFIIGTKGNDVLQYSLSTGFDISTISFVGGLHLHAEAANPSGIAFSKSGLKMFITGDSSDEVNEYHLKCPFNLFVGKCSSFITQDSDRTGMAEAQIEVTKRTIKHATNTALNRLKWIRRNKDKQNLSNQNVKLNFSNSQFHLLKKYQHAFISKSTTSKNDTNSNKNYFYWHEVGLSFSLPPTFIDWIQQFKTFNGRQISQMSPPPAPFVNKQTEINTLLYMIQNSKDIIYIGYNGFLFPFLSGVENSTSVLGTRGHISSAIILDIQYSCRKLVVSFFVSSITPEC